MRERLMVLHSTARRAVAVVAILAIAAIRRLTVAPRSSWIPG